MRFLVYQKTTGCYLEVVEFSNGKVVACWQTIVPEIAVYESLDQFFSVRTPERGYHCVYDSAQFANGETINVREGVNTQ